MEGSEPRPSAFSSSKISSAPSHQGTKEKRDRSSSTADSTAAESIAADSIIDGVADSTTTGLSPDKKLRNNSKLWWTEELQYLKHEVTLSRVLFDYLEMMSQSSEQRTQSIIITEPFETAKMNFLMSWERMVVVVMRDLNFMLVGAVNPFLQPHTI